MSYEDLLEGVAKYEKFAAEAASVLPKVNDIRQMLGRMFEQEKIGKYLVTGSDTDVADIAGRTLSIKYAIVPFQGHAYGKATVLFEGAERKSAYIDRSGNLYFNEPLNHALPLQSSKDVQEAIGEMFGWAVTESVESLGH